VNPFGLAPQQRILHCLHCLAGVAARVVNGCSAVELEVPAVHIPIMLCEDGIHLISQGPVATL
jgi:hypothetical protein